MGKEEDQGLDQELIEAAKRALGTSEDWPEYMESEFLRAQRSYQTWEFHHTGPKLGEYTEIFREVQKAGRKYLREIKRLDIWRLPYGRVAVEKDLEFIGLLLGYLGETPKRKGRPIDYRLRNYIFLMACWYNEFIGKNPRYGTYSIFTRLVGDCISVLDEKYLNNPPYSAIRDTLIEVRKLRPELPPISLIK